MRDDMRNKVWIGTGAVALAATALGGMLLIRGENSAPSDSAPGGALLRTSPADEVDYFADGSERPQREIDTNRPPSTGVERSEGGWGGFIERLDEFDTDGDGILSADERRAMMRQIREEWRQLMDLDGDGEISQEERRQARLERLNQSAWGRDMLGQFDADGDGVLNEAEQAALEESRQERREERRQSQLERFDSDGDGELSREERQAQREQQQSRRGDFMREMTSEFDRDGDGQLSIEESQDAWAAMAERRAVDQFVGRYDSNGDGNMAAGDLDDFLSDFERGDDRADVNGDGEVNSADLNAYVDMVARWRNRP